MPESKTSNIILQYQGPLDYDKIGDLIQELKNNMKNRNIRFGLYKKVLTLLIETLENIIRYRETLPASSPEINDFPPKISIHQENSEYMIEVSNPVRKADAVLLAERIEELNGLDRKEIKELYKATITNGQFTERGGAGLGMIEMVKLSDKKLQYSFSEINDAFSSFSLRLTVKSSLIKK